MSNFCKRRARQIAADEIQKFAAKHHDLQATPESIKRANAAADAALREDQRGVVVDVEKRAQ